MFWHPIGLTDVHCDHILTRLRSLKSRAASRPVAYLVREYSSITTVRFDTFIPVNVCVNEFLCALGPSGANGHDFVHHIRDVPTVEV